MSDERFSQHLANQLDAIRTAGTFKSERVIDSAQGADIQVAGNTVPLTYHGIIIKST